MHTPPETTLLTRLRTYRASMAPHMKDREGGRLLLSALDEIERLNAALSPGGLAPILASAGVVQEDAVYSPDAYDNGIILARIHAVSDRLLLRDEAPAVKQQSSPSQS